MYIYTCTEYIHSSMFRTPSNLGQVLPCKIGLYDHHSYPYVLTDQSSETAWKLNEAHKDGSLGRPFAQIPSASRRQSAVSKVQCRCICTCVRVCLCLRLRPRLRVRLHVRRARLFVRLRYSIVHVHVYDLSQSLWFIYVYTYTYIYAEREGERERERERTTMSYPRQAVRFHPGDDKARQICADTPDSAFTAAGPQSYGWRFREGTLPNSERGFQQLSVESYGISGGVAVFAQKAWASEAAFGASSIHLRRGPELLACNIYEPRFVLW